MTAIVIRTARAGERQALEDLQRRASLALPDYREQLLAHPDAISLAAEEIDAGRVLVAEDGAASVGFANWIAGAAPAEAELDGLFVDPGRWRGGIGRLLVEAIAAAVRADGRVLLTVIAGPTAIPFYRRCGFTSTGEAQTRFGPASLMVRSLL